jgi:hypothetical protein
MGAQVQDLVRGVLAPLGLMKGSRKSAAAGLPVLEEEDTSHGGIVMVFTAIAGVAMYAFEPAATSVLFSVTLVLAIYTTRRPETMAWDVYHTAMTRPLPDRIAMLKQAQEIAPRNDQIVFALGWSLAQSGRYADAVDILRGLDERRPDHAAVSSALSVASRMLLAQAATQRAQSA